FQYVAAAGLALREFEPYAGAPHLDLVGERDREWRRARWVARGRVLAVASTATLVAAAVAGSTMVEADIITAQKTLVETETSLQKEQGRYNVVALRIQRTEQVKQVAHTVSEPVRLLWDFVAAAAPAGISLTG